MVGLGAELDEVVPGEWVALGEDVDAGLEAGVVGRELKGHKGKDVGLDRFRILRGRGESCGDALHTRSFHKGPPFGIDTLLCNHLAPGIAHPLVDDKYGVGIGRAPSLPVCLDLVLGHLSLLRRTG